MAAELGLTALHDGLEKVPDDVWHKIPYFCPPEEKEKKKKEKRNSKGRRDSKQQDSKQRPKRASRTRSYSASDAERRRLSSNSKKVPSDIASETSGARPAASHAAAAAAAAAAASAQPHAAAAAAAAPPNIGVAFTDPFIPPNPAPLDGYSDGPAPAFIPAPAPAPSQSAPSAQQYIPHSQAYSQAQQSYQGPRHSVATSAPMSTPGPASGQQPYFPPPPRGDEYARSSYDPSRYQPASDYAPRDSRGGPNDEAVGNYYGGDDRYGGRAASADPYSRHGRSSRYDDYDDDDRDDRSRHRRSKSKSSRHSDKEGGERGLMDKVHNRFDTTDGALGSSALGAVVGGIIGHKFGKGPLATVAGAAIGGIGVNAWEAHRHHQKDRNMERSLEKHSGRRSGSADAVDSRTRKDIEYYGARADDDRVSRRASGRYSGDPYDEESDQGYDSGEDRRRRKRSSSRRRRDDEYGR
ncbi:hypothetical protein FH972_021527 [Carpinus fangiana]|uniref:Glycine zipper 2TM domain-containing protein n=1 Tax=Carpinus fangiana TaxID=176857 RepID=A0A5N6KQ69_9ROSI|nr:hypothetical protein FH972_021527 [Carpinus fangiana]